ncbi:hypothetical protein ACHAXS_000976 [Conticribra weissflogii]
MAIDDDFCHLLGHSVKMGGINIRHKTKNADCLFAASNDATAILVKNFTTNADFSIKAHCAQVRQALATMHQDCMTKEEAFLEELSSLNCGLRNHIDTAKKSGA